MQVRLKNSTPSSNPTVDWSSEISTVPGLANSVIGSIHAHCRAALEKAVTEKLIRPNPAIGCKLPSKKTPEVKILTPEAMQKLLYQARIEGFYEMFMLDLATGLRRGEVVGLQWKDIDFETGTLSVTKQVRYVKGELKIEPPKTKASNEASSSLRPSWKCSPSIGKRWIRYGCSHHPSRMRTCREIRQHAERLLPDSQESRVRACAVPRHAPYLRFQCLPLRHGRQNLWRAR